MRGTNPVTVQDVKSQLRIMKRMFSDSMTNLEDKMSTQFLRCTQELTKVEKIVKGDDDYEESEGSASGNDEEGQGEGDRVESSARVKRSSRASTNGSMSANSLTPPAAS